MLSAARTIECRRDRLRRLGCILGRGRRAGGWLRRSVRLIDVRHSAFLQGPHIRDNRPTVSDGNLRPVSGHFAEAVGDNVKDITDGGLSQTVIVITLDARKAALGNHAVAVAERPVTNDAINVEAFLPAIQCFFGDGGGKFILESGFKLFKSQYYKLRDG